MSIVYKIGIAPVVAPVALAGLDLTSLDAGIAQPATASMGLRVRSDHVLKLIRILAKRWYLQIRELRYQVILVLVGIVVIIMCCI